MAPGFSKYPPPHFQTSGSVTDSTWWCPRQRTVSWLCRWLGHWWEVEWRGLVYCELDKHIIISLDHCNSLQITVQSIHTQTHIGSSL